MFNVESRIPPALSSLSSRGRELLDRLDAHKQRARAEQEANKLTRLLVKDHTHHTKLTLTDGNTLEIKLSGGEVYVFISQDQKPPFRSISTAGWCIRTKELLVYEEFDSQGLRVGSVWKDSDPLSKDESLYKAIDLQGGIRDVDFDTGLRRRVFGLVANMFTLAREALALEKTTRRLLSHHR